MRLLIFLAIVFLISCKTGSKLPANASIEEKANYLAQKFIITDGHVDLPYRLKVKNFRLEPEYLGIPISTDEGDFDYVRSKQGGLDAPFMSIFIPARYQEDKGAAKAHAIELIDMIEGIAAAHPENFGIAKTPQDVERQFKEGLVSLPMGMENGAPIEDDISNVKYFRNRGISYITLTHSKVNQISDSSYDTTRTWNGLSPFGEEVVKEMNRVGVMVDISHVSDSAFYDVMRLTDIPVIASHSSCRKFVPGFERNMSDDMIIELGINGGVIMINFGSTFIDINAKNHRDSLRRELAKILKSQNLSANDELAKPIVKIFGEENPTLFADVKMVADHIDHVVDLIGIEHVGFGSDYDGVGDTLPLGLKDVSTYPNLIAELLRRGYSESDIEKICYKNLWRVWNTVLNKASI